MHSSSLLCYLLVSIAVKEFDHTQVKLDYGLPESASARGAPDMERLLVVCSPAARDALLTAAGLANAPLGAAAREAAQDASAEASLRCISISGGLLEDRSTNPASCCPVPMQLRMWTGVVNA